MAIEFVLKRAGTQAMLSERSLSAEVSDRFSDSFRSSNRSLQELVGTRYSLAELGYQL